MTVHNVSVTRSDRLLSLSPSQVTLTGPEDLVDWSFESPLGDQELVFVLFHSPEGQPFGPFQTLEPENQRIRGFGNNGIVDEYNYTIFVLSNEVVVAQSDGTDSVANTSSEVNSSPSATVLYAAGGLVVSPHRLQVETGRTAIWYVENLPDGHFVTFEFDAIQNPHDDVLIGPFASLVVTRGLGNAQVTMGVDFRGDYPQTYIYHVKLRRPDGSVVTRTDPVIEPPPGWPP